MRWKSGRRSRNVRDRRGTPMRRGLMGGGLGAILIVLVALYFGVDPTPFLQGIQVSQTQTQPASPTSVADDPLSDFISVVLADTEDTWNPLFQQMGRQYQEPELVLFSGATRSACGIGQAAMGPFYCPADNKVYIDLSFYRDLRERHQAPGDFAQAYVIAHEVGHHVQNLLGISGQVHEKRRRGSKIEGNALSVRLELQADCFAGVWAHQANQARQILETGDIEEGLNAASAIGDDRLQRQSRGYVTPDSFTHGSSEQRVRWFKRGLNSGRMSECDTFTGNAG